MTTRDRNMHVHKRVLSIEVLLFGAGMTYASASSGGLQHGFEMLIVIVIAIAFAIYAGITTLALHFGLAEYRHAAFIVHAASFVALGAVVFGFR